MDTYLNTAAASASSSKCCNDNKSPGICPEMVKPKGHQLLANWVWSYFSDNNHMPTKPKPACNRFVVTEKAPLYFQHDGRSRTIVGIQLKSLPNGMQQHNLLILDPTHLCYMDPGIATGPEMEKLKTLDSTRFEF